MMTSSTRVLIYSTLCLLAWSTTPAISGCYDLSNAEPRSLSGFLTNRIFPGPPGYEDVQKGDTPEPAYILALPYPICIQGDEFADPHYEFDEVHLVATDDTSEALRSLVNSDVEVTVAEPMAAHTGHHHKPLVAWVTSVTSFEVPTSEYGTAATTVRAFYFALSAGNGETATTYLIPRKQNKGAFSAERMSDFYGRLNEPLDLIDLVPQGPNEYLVRYTFRSGSAACNGRAIVTTTIIDDQFYIESIRALDGC